METSVFKFVFFSLFFALKNCIDGIFLKDIGDKTLKIFENQKVPRFRIFEGKTVVPFVS